MEKKKIILGYRPIIDHNVLGFTYYKVFLSLSGYTKEDLVRIKEHIRKNPATIYLIEGIELHATLDFEMMVKDNKELFGFIKGLRRAFIEDFGSIVVFLLLVILVVYFIGSYSTVIFMDTLKVEYLPG